MLMAGPQEVGYWAAVPRLTARPARSFALVRFLANLSPLLPQHINERAEPGGHVLVAGIIEAQAWERRRLLLGSDAVRLVEEKKKSLQAEFDAWKSVSLSTDVA